MAGLLRDFLADHGLTLWHFYGGLGAIAIVLTLVYYIGKATDPIGGHFSGDAEDMARGGCILVLLCLAGLVIAAVLVWSWRVLFAD